MIQHQGTQNNQRMQTEPLPQQAASSQQQRIQSHRVMHDRGQNVCYAGSIVNTGSSMPMSNVGQPDSHA
jgi:hypothetical protein